MATFGCEGGCFELPRNSRNDRFNMIDAAVEVAEIAGKAILEIYAEGNVEVTTKADNSPLTKADLLSDQIIRNFLESQFGIPVISEERPLEFEQRRNLKQFWLVDPLDGTKDFIKRTDEFCINIALIEAGVPTIGVVNIPAIGELFYAWAGNGAFKKTAGKIARINNSSKRSDLICTESRFHPSEQLQSFCERYKITKIQHLGAGTKLCRLAEGAVDVCPRFQGSSEWDTAAPHCIIKEANCKIIDIVTREAVLYNKDSFRNNYYIASRNDLDFSASYQ